MIYGYVRVSTKEHNEIRQLIAMEKRKISKKIFLLIKKAERILKEKVIPSLSGD